MLIPTLGTMTTKPPPPPTPCSEVEWATTTCPLTWATKGVYNNGEKALRDRLGDFGADPGRRRQWLNKILESREHRVDLFERSGVALGLREVSFFVYEFDIYE